MKLQKKKLLIGIILIALALLIINHFYPFLPFALTTESNGLLSVADPSNKCQDTACCKNAGYDYFDTPLNSCYSAGDLDYTSGGGGGSG